LIGFVDFCHELLSVENGCDAVVEVKSKFLEDGKFRSAVVGKEDDVSLFVDELVEFGSEFANCCLLRLAKEKVLVAISPGAGGEVVLQ
jgi:hypothetical protein